MFRTNFSIHAQASETLQSLNNTILTSLCCFPGRSRRLVPLSPTSHSCKKKSRVHAYLSPPPNTDSPLGFPVGNPTRLRPLRSAARHSNQSTGRQQDRRRHLQTRAVSTAMRTRSASVYTRRETMFFLPQRQSLHSSSITGSRTCCHLVVVLSSSSGSHAHIQREFPW